MCLVLGAWFHSTLICSPTRNQGSIRHEGRNPREPGGISLPKTWDLRGGQEPDGTVMSSESYLDGARSRATCDRIPAVRRRQFLFMPSSESHLIHPRAWDCVTTRYGMMLRHTRIRIPLSRVHHLARSCLLPISLHSYMPNSLVQRLLPSPSSVNSCLSVQIKLAQSHPAWCSIPSPSPFPSLALQLVTKPHPFNLSSVIECLFSRLLRHFLTSLTPVRGSRRQQ